MEWQISSKPVDYPQALESMEARVAGILAGKSPELVWLLEHSPLYTAGTSASKNDLLASRFPTYETGRGGQWTYHGPGQRIGYLMLNLKARGNEDLRAYVKNLERWLVATLGHFDVEAFTREGRIGVWTNTPKGEAKIAALGIRVRQWVTFHGVSLNVNPDLSHYTGIVPCGIQEYGVTSLHALGIKATMDEVDAMLKEEFQKVFG